MQIQPRVMCVEGLVSSTVIDAINPALVGRMVSIADPSSFSDPSLNPDKIALIKSYEMVVRNSHISQVIVAYINFNEIVCENQSISLRALPDWRWELIVIVEAQRQALISICQRITVHVKTYILEKKPFLQLPAFVGEIDKISDSLQNEDSQPLMVRRGRLNTLETNLNRQLFALSLQAEQQLEKDFFRKFAVTKSLTRPVSYVLHPPANTIFRVVLVANAILDAGNQEEPVHFEIISTALGSYSTQSLFNIILALSTKEQTLFTTEQPLSLKDREQFKKEVAQSQNNQALSQIYFGKNERILVCNFIKNNANLELVKKAISKLSIKPRAIAMSILVELLMEIESPFEAYKLATVIPDQKLKQRALDNTMGFLAANGKNYLYPCLALPDGSEKTSQLVLLLKGFINKGVMFQARKAFDALPEVSEKHSLLLPMADLFIQNKDYLGAEKLINHPKFPVEKFAIYMGKMPPTVGQDGCVWVDQEWEHVVGNVPSVDNMPAFASDSKQDLKRLGLASQELERIQNVTTFKEELRDDIIQAAQDYALKAVELAIEYVLLIKDPKVKEVFIEAYKDALLDRNKGDQFASFLAVMS